MGITIVVFIAQEGTKSLLGVDLPALLGMKINSRIADGELWRLFTPMLLHGSFLHIGFNMYALNIFGPQLERQFGHLRFLALYVLGGFAGNVGSMIFSAAPSLGTSTAIFGLLGAQGVFIYQNRELLGARAQGALRSILAIAGINLVIGLSPGIDNWGHLGGLVGGSLFTWFAGPLLGVEGIYPAYAVSDHRNPASVVLAVVGVGGIFAMLAAAAILLRGV